ncbi:hypothetical protein Rhopal_007388-T1 [Rhodotorula paludigena]|uniref:Major facilitator superfamily (MFS) profile domain-containing protein n=1 Tax=Rhodotorula paludigena TaxID=86838 RepID=A0AAV5GUV7_9BASI|nr:hypothetical protein Rhopal_007388-T1 [Rhodotorula paludigena]
MAPSPPRSRPASPASEPSDDDHPLHLAPHTVASPALAAYEGDPPAVLADRLLLRHTDSGRSIPRAPRPDAAHLDHPTASNPGSAIELDDAALGGHAPAHSPTLGRAGEPDAAADAHSTAYATPGTRPSDGDDDRDDEARSSRSRSKSRTRKLRWYQRPSPVWFFPGTICMALTMGMTVAPKLEIYTQLICRAMPVDKSGVTLPPPVLDRALPGSAMDPLPRTPGVRIPPSGNGSESESATAAPVNEHETKFLFEWIADSPHSVPAAGAHHAYGASATTAAAGGLPDAGNGGVTWSEQCRKSGAVQGAVAELAWILTMLMGLVSCVTALWWGSYSDRRGRKPVLLVSLAGAIMMDSVFLLTVHYHDVLSYNFLFLGPLLDGLVGGYTTAQAVVYAYLSDCTPAGSRARVFSLLGGCMMFGFALGPLLGSYLITAASPSPTAVLAPFYAALALHALYWLVMACVLPESLSRDRQLKARERHAVDRKLRREQEEADERACKSGAERAWLSVGGEGKGLEDEERRTNIEWGAHLDEYAHPEDVWRGRDGAAAAGGKGAGRKRDWSLTKVATAYACNMLLLGVMATKLIYANYEFGWTSVEDGLYLSFIGFLRVFALVVILPLVIRLVRRRAPPSPSRPRPAEAGAAQKAWDGESRWLKVVADSHFDLGLARWSLVLDLAGYLLFSLAPLVGAPRGSDAHTATFLVAIFVQSLGSGASPAIQSLALAHASPRDAGTLFASLGVVQALASQVVGPGGFSLLFKATIGTFDEAIFVAALACSAAGLATLLLVRLRRVYVQPRSGGAAEGEHADAEARAEDEEPGRSAGMRKSASASSGEERERARGRSEHRRGSAPALA